MFRGMRSISVVGSDMPCHTCATTARPSRLICHCDGTQQQQQQQQQLRLRLAQQQQQTHHADHAASSYAALRDWVTDHGGFIHPNLQLVEQAPTGCRGVVAAVDIEMQHLEQGPILIIPQHLQFTEKQAIDIIHECGSCTLAESAQQQLSQVQLLAGALAHLLTHTSSSRSQYWQPYLQTLPADPPSPWLLSTPTHVSACIQPYVTSGRLSTAVASDWLQQVARHRQTQLLAAEEVAQLLGAALQIDRRQVLQALGQLYSRVLTSSKGSGLVPCIDLLNHSGDAMAPMLQLLDTDELVMTVVPIRQGKAVPLLTGEELLIAYQGGYTPLEAFLKFGFVADEWWDS